MACSIDATVGGASANSYASISAADAYHASHLEFETWDNLDTDQKCQALQQATRLLEAQMDWCGWVASSTQALAWPRTGVIGRNGYVLSATSIPLPLQQATAELARLLVRRQTLAAAVNTSAGTGLKSIKAGPIDVEFDGTTSTAVATADAISDDVFYLLTGLGTLRRRGAGSIPLRRV